MVMSFSKQYRKRIGANIQRLREDLKLTRTVFGEKHLHVSRQWVYAMETGNANLTIDRLAQIAKALNTTVDELVGASKRKRA